MSQLISEAGADRPEESKQEREEKDGKRTLTQDGAEEQSPGTLPLPTARTADVGTLPGG